MTDKQQDLASPPAGREHLQNWYPDVQAGHVYGVLPNEAVFAVADVVPYGELEQDAIDDICHQIGAAPALLSELQALVTAVRFADPPKEFNGVLCHEARVPVAFIEGAEAAIARARGQS